MDFNATKYKKFIGRGLDSTLQLPFEKSLLIDIVSNNNIWIIWKAYWITPFYNYMSVKVQIFFIWFNRNNILQKTECRSRWKFSYLLLNQTWNRFEKQCRTMPRLSLINFLFLKIQLFYLCVCVLVTQSCLTFCKPMDCSLLGSSVHGTLQAKILEWVTIPLSRGSCWPRDWTLVSCISGRFFGHLNYPGSPVLLILTYNGIYYYFWKN